jgi:hypothetical protein
MKASYVVAEKPKLQAKLYKHSKMATSAVMNQT